MFKNCFKEMLYFGQLVIFKIAVVDPGVDGATLAEGDSEQKEGVDDLDDGDEGEAAAEPQPASTRSYERERAHPDISLHGHNVGIPQENLVEICVKKIKKITLTKAMFAFAYFSTAFFRPSLSSAFSG